MDNLTPAKAEQLGLDQEGLISLVNQLTNALKQSNLEIKNNLQSLEYYKSLIDTVENFAEEMSSMGHTLLDFCRASGPFVDDDEPQNPF